MEGVTGVSKQRPSSHRGELDVSKPVRVGLAVNGTHGKLNVGKPGGVVVISRRCFVVVVVVVVVFGIDLDLYFDFYHDTFTRTRTEPGIFIG